MDSLLHTSFSSDSRASLTERVWVYSVFVCSHESHTAECRDADKGCLTALFLTEPETDLALRGATCAESLHADLSKYLCNTCTHVCVCAHAIPKIGGWA